MPDQNWDEIEGIFLEAADLPPDMQRAYLDKVCGHNPEVRHCVERMLHADTEGGSAIALAVQNAAAEMLLKDDGILPTQLGPYRILELIGHGGMGTVYLAERADDHFKKLVAIKVVKAGMDSSEVLDRFRHERQILAGLEHPYIARLIDGGTTADGRPFFVMERVEGQAIDAYCRDHKLDVTSILRLFLRVCEGISYAHRALVVHRDLKPGNILVDRDGVPKLLDFGVAKLLRSDGVGAATMTSLGAGPLTPEYASPEQVRGLPITTATDVYALGAILFELLTGKRAQKIDTLTPREIDRVVCETEPPLASVVCRETGRSARLASDLDNIIAMAMRKESARRYSSVEQFAGDISRYLAGRPVIARADSLPYRTGKFLRRNRLAISAATIVVVSLVSGIAVAIQQARRAEAARQVADVQRQAAEAERQIADQERTRAESSAKSANQERDRSKRRLAQMVDLANRSLYDVHSAIEPLPGAIEARRKIVATTLDFLRRLAADAGGDDELRLVLSEAYVKVGDVQGYPLRPNLGDVQGALASYKNALALLQGLLAKDRDNLEYRLLRLQAEDGRLAVLAWKDKQRPVIEALGNLLPEARRIALRCPRDQRCLMAEVRIESALMEHLAGFDTQASLDHATRVVDLLEHAVRILPPGDELQSELADAYSQKAKALNTRIRQREAMEAYRRAIEIREALLRSTPNNVLLRRSLMITYGNMGGNLGSPLYPNLGDTAGAEAAYGKALAIARELAAADPNNKLALSDLANALRLYATLDLPKEKYPQSLEKLQEAESIFKRLLADDPGSLSKLTWLMSTQTYAGRRLQELGDTEKAVAYYRESLRAVDQLLARNSSLNLLSQAMSAEKPLAELLCQQGRCEEALSVGRAGIARIDAVVASESERARLSGFRAGANAILADVHAAMGNWPECRDAAKRALSEWQVSGPRYGGYDAPRVESLLHDAEAHLR